MVMEIKKKRSSRTAVKDVRQRVRRAMQQEQMDSDESDKDFGFNAQNPEEDDVQIDSAELDSASDVEKNQKNEKDQDANAQYNGISAKKDEKEIRSKKRKRTDLSETTTTSLPIKTENTNEN